MNQEQINEKDLVQDIATDSKKVNVEIWDDLVYIKDLLISIAICFITTFGGYFIAPNEAPKPLLFGIVGAFIGFIIASLMIKPKRNFIESEGSK